MTIGNATKLERKEVFVRCGGRCAGARAGHSPCGVGRGAGEMPLQPIPLPQL